MRATMTNKLLLLLVALMLAAGLAHAQTPKPFVPVEVTINGYKGNPVQSDSIALSPADTVNLNVVTMYREGGQPVDALKPVLIRKGLKVVVRWNTTPPFTDGRYEIRSGTRTVRSGPVHIATQGTILPTVAPNALLDVYSQIGVIKSSSDSTAARLNRTVSRAALDSLAQITLSIGDTSSLVRKTAYALDKTATSTAISQRILRISTVAALTATYGANVGTVRLTEKYRSGTFNWASSGSVDNGVVFPAPDGVWIRDFEGNAVNPWWWGVKPDYRRSNGTGTDNGPAMNAACAFAASDSSQIYGVRTPPGQYGFASTFYIPPGVDFYGMGALESFNKTGTKFFHKPGFNGDIVRFIGSIDASSGRNYWFGKLHDFSIEGNTTNSSGLGINFRTASGATVTPQDQTIIDNIIVRFCPSGGFAFPNGALPLTMRNIKLLWNGGPGILLTVTGANSFQSVNFTDVSGDGNVGGMIRLVGLDRQGEVKIVNGKSEERFNAPFGNMGQQSNPIVIENCVGTPINIDGFTHVSSVKDSTGITYKKPGSLISIINSTPVLDWNTVAIRVRTADTGPDPTIIDGLPLSYSTTSGSYGGISSQFGNSTGRSAFVIGRNSQWLGRSADNSFAETDVVSINGTKPGLHFYESDAPTNKHSWLLTPDGGSLFFKYIKDNGSAATMFKFNLDNNGDPLLQEAIVPEFRLTDVAPKWTINNTSGTTDNKIYQWNTSATELRLQYFNDSYGGGVTGAGFIRSGTTHRGFTLRQPLILTAAGSVIGTLAVSAAAADSRSGSIYTVTAAAAQNLQYLTNGTIGQYLILRFNDANTTLIHGTDAGGVTLFGAANWTPTAGASLVLYRDATSWIEVSRSSSTGNVRLTTVQRNAISAPTEGFSIYNTTTHADETWNGTAWTSAVSSTTYATDKGVQGVLDGLQSTSIASNASAIANAEPGVLKFNTYALAVAGLVGRTKPCRVLIKYDEVNNVINGVPSFGKYDYDGEGNLIEDVL